jgi:hypothetical protein
MITVFPDEGFERGSVLDEKGFTECRRQSASFSAKFSDRFCYQRNMERETSVYFAFAREFGCLKFWGRTRFQPVLLGLLTVSFLVQFYFY